MTAHSDILAARHDVHRTREQLDDTLLEIEARIAAPVDAVKRRLDVRQAIEEHPWIALGVALGAGALVASSGADTRAATLAAEQAKKAAAAARDGTVAGATAGAQAVREAPSRSRAALGIALDAIGGKLAVALVDALREPSNGAASPPSQP